MISSEPTEPRIENIDQYELQKLTTTLTEAEHLAAVIKNYLETLKYCDEHGIQVPNRTKLDNIRSPGSPTEKLNELSRIFESGMTEMAKNLTEEQGNEVAIRTNSK